MCLSHSIYLPHGIRIFQRLFYYKKNKRQLSSLWSEKCKFKFTEFLSKDQLLPYYYQYPGLTRRLFTFHIKQTKKEGEFKILADKTWKKTYLNIQWVKYEYDPVNCERKIVLLLNEINKNFPSTCDD